MLIKPLHIHSNEGEQAIAALLDRFQPADSSCGDTVRDRHQAQRPHLEGDARPVLDLSGRRSQAGRRGARRAQ